MDLRTYLRTEWGMAVRLAKKLGMSAVYLRQIANDRFKDKRPSPETAIAIEEATAGAVSRSELRPDLWPPAASEAEQQPCQAVRA